MNDFNNLNDMVDLTAESTKLISEIAKSLEMANTLKMLEMLYNVGELPKDQYIELIDKALRK